MDKLSRQKFYDIQTGDEICYVDDTDCRCQGVVTGWRNHNDLPALLIGIHGAQVVTLAQVVSRTRNGATKKWSTK